MQQSPPLNASQILVDQQRIHTHNVNSFMLVLSNISNEFDAEYTYLESKQKADRMLSIYIMHGSNQNYTNAYEAINETILAFQAIVTQRLLSKAETPKAQAVVAPDSTDNQLEDSDTNKVYFDTEIGQISYHVLSQYKDNQQVLICSQSSWQDLQKLSANEIDTWFYKMLEPLNLNRCPELNIFDKLPVKGQYEILMRIHKLSFAIDDNKVHCKTKRINIGKFGAIEKMIVTDWDIENVQ